MTKAPLAPLAPSSTKRRELLRIYHFVKVSSELDRSNQRGSNPGESQIILTHRAQQLVVTTVERIVSSARDYHRGRLNTLSDSRNESWRKLRETVIERERNSNGS
ncbi:hypothetical protein PUN28_001023 [Cardiocondyla obscurior]|uniref:Uncharacterized protein n=1 Tax=Cardiocondyla obscurior TaxID=286306 RepID=A0AAW2H2H2_9HYME